MSLYVVQELAMIWIFIWMFSELFFLGSLVNIHSLTIHQAFSGGSGRAHPCAKVRTINASPCHESTFSWRMTHVHMRC